jgi:hypothetical protein
MNDTPRSLSSQPRASASGSDLNDNNNNILKLIKHQRLIKKEQKPDNSKIARAKTMLLTRVDRRADLGLEYRLVVQYVAPIKPN